MPSGGAGRRLRSLLQPETPGAGHVQPETPGAGHVQPEMLGAGHSGSEGCRGRYLRPLFLAGSWASCAEGQGRLWVLARVRALTHACLPPVLQAVRCYVIPEAVCLYHVCMCVPVSRVSGVSCVVVGVPSCSARTVSLRIAGEAAAGFLQLLLLRASARYVPGESQVGFPSCTGIIRRAVSPQGPLLPLTEAC